MNCSRRCRAEVAVPPPKHDEFWSNRSRRIWLNLAPLAEDDRSKLDSEATPADAANSSPSDFAARRPSTRKRHRQSRRILLLIARRQRRSRKSRRRRKNDFSPSSRAKRSNPEPQGELDCFVANRIRNGQRLNHQPAHARERLEGWLRRTACSHPSRRGENAAPEDGWEGWSDRDRSARPHKTIPPRQPQAWRRSPPVCRSGP